MSDPVETSLRINLAALHVADLGAQARCSADPDRCAALIREMEYVVAAMRAICREHLEAELIRRWREEEQP